MFEALQELSTIVDEHNKLLREKGEIAVKDALKAFLEKHPVIDSVKWQQYTPYFNDGEPCTFGVHTPYVVIEGNEYGDYGEFDLDKEHKDIQADLNQLEGAFGKLEDVMQAVFGDHVEVTVTRTSIEIDDYSHD